MKKRTAYRMAMILCASFFLSGCGLFPFQQDVPFLSERAGNKGADSESTGSGTQETINGNAHDLQGQVSEDSEESESQTAEQEQVSTMEKASLLAAQYDYDGAIELLQSQPDYDSSEEMQDAVSEYENAKATCVEYPLDQITHIFFHTLIKDTSKAFDGDSDSGRFNQVLTTIDVFIWLLVGLYE